MGVGLKILHLELKGSQTSNIYLCTVHAIYVQGLENSATHNINNSILVIYVYLEPRARVEVHGYKHAQ